MHTYSGFPFPVRHFPNQVELFHACILARTAQLLSRLSATYGTKDFANHALLFVYLRTSWLVSQSASYQHRPKVSINCTWNRAISTKNHNRLDHNPRHTTNRVSSSAFDEHKAGVWFMLHLFPTLHDQRRRNTLSNSIQHQHPTSTNTSITARRSFLPFGRAEKGNARGTDPSSRAFARFYFILLSQVRSVRVG